ncbi:sensor histidine kinase YesM [Pedobacter cryoconitis]|uniref:Sensor histidine kinase YesM n=1 Tax=Pedobacter cryoconitis TaxID=188932 RepID=A0A7W8YYB4_9SPHI|nr:histidine kinase [Pedobacter cryoconitis]MBB5624074.1 sensor histidine kinase YesM [Pedobacter cryoconitis]
MQISNRQRLIFYHLFFWLIYFSLYSFYEFVNIPDKYFFSLVDVLVTHLSSLIIVYLSIYLFSKYTIPNKPLQLIIGVFFIHIINCIVWYIIENYITPYILVNPAPISPSGFYASQAVTGYITMKYMIFGFAYAFTLKMIRHERKRNLLEKERLEAEYAFLRAQINPHFLNNTLNFFYAKALPLSEELADGIMTLSQIMHYSLDRNDNNRMVMLSDELLHVRNVIKLNQMRFSNRLQINLDFRVTSSSIQIIPLVIITIVENILKHGDCSLANDPAKISLSVSDDGCFFYLNTYNKKSKWAAGYSSGIGVENIEKRMAHHYGKDFQLTIDNNDVSYSLSLKLPVFHKVEFYTSNVNRLSSENQIDWSKLFAKKKFRLS